MFGLMGMIGTYESRNVANYTDDKKGLIIDTVAVTDSDKPYETGICHPRYNDGKWVIVELYDTKELSICGHKKWLKIMTAKKLPKTLKDVSTCEIKKMIERLN